MTLLSSITDLFASLMSSSSSSTDPFQPPTPPWTGEPTILDVLALKQFFLERKPYPLPAELIDIIIDLAEYWPHTTSFPHPSCRANQDGNILVTRSMPLGYPDLSVPITYPLREADYASDSQRFFPALPYMGKNYDETTPRVLEEWKKLSMPDTQLEHPCRKIVFNIRSHDQGWGGQHHHHGTYEGSFTWFDIGLQRLKGVGMSEIPESALGKKTERAEPEEDEDDYSSEDERTTQEERFLMFHNRGTSIGQLEGWDGLRFDLEEVDPPFLPRELSQEEDERMRRGLLEHPFLPHEKTLQKNLTATKQFTDHEVVLRWDHEVDPEAEEALDLERKGHGKEIMTGELVRNLKVGDVVSVWARARFPGWINVVDSVEIKVYWVV